MTSFVNGPIHSFRNLKDKIISFPDPDVYSAKKKQVLPNSCNFLNFWSWIKKIYLGIRTARDLFISGVFCLLWASLGDPYRRYTLPSHQNLTKSGRKPLKTRFHRNLIIKSISSTLQNTRKLTANC